MLPHGSAIRPWPSGKIMAATPPQTPEAAHIRAAYIFLYVSRRQHMHAPGIQTSLAGGSIYQTLASPLGARAAGVLALVHIIVATKTKNKSAKAVLGSVADAGPVG
jgi:hypothetical protein